MDGGDGHYAQRLTSRVCHDDGRGLNTQGENVSDKIKDEIMIDGEPYVRKSHSQPAEPLDDMPYRIVRTRSAGVFAGYVKRHEGREVDIVNARRIWYWAGAASLSQLAVEGTSKPEDCKFPCEVPLITVTEAIELLAVSERARLSIKEVTPWKN